MAPRPHTPKTRGRRNVSASTRQLTPKNNPDDTYQEWSQKKRKGGAKTRVSGVTKTYRKKNGKSTKVQDLSSTEGSSDEADVEDAEEDDNNEPAVTAPSRAPKSLKSHAAGRYQYQDAEDTMSDANDSDSMFGNNAPQGVPLNNEEEEEDDDDIYRGVEDIGDSDPDNVSQKEMTFLEDELNFTNGLSGIEDDEDPSSFYLNQIEGMSAYGFGDNSEADGTVQFHMSSQSSDDGERRHARFEDSFPEQKSVFRLSESPTMTRALLPSALPHSMAAVAQAHYGNVSEASSDYDSDVTEDCLPEAAEDASDMEDYIPEESSPSDIAQSKLREGKGPPTGTFIHEGDKSAGTLDATGKMLIITNPHHLGEEFARRYGASAPPSPGVGFAEAVFEDEDSQSTINKLTGPVPDPMPSSLNGSVNLASNGQATGPPEAWFADASTFQSLLDDGDTDFEGLDAGERQMRLEDVITFDVDDDDDDDDDLITSPAFMSGDLHGTPRNNLAHLNTNNLMAFRRGTDPAFAGFQSSPPAPQRGYFATPKPSRSARKRKKFNDSPYSTPLYKGVTPIRRTARSSYSTANTNDATSPLKRRRTLV